jgi:hypothetical protein
MNLFTLISKMFGRRSITRWIVIDVGQNRLPARLALSRGRRAGELLPRVDSRNGEVGKSALRTAVVRQKSWQPRAGGI